MAHRSKSRGGNVATFGSLELVTLSLSDAELSKLRGFLIQKALSEPDSPSLETVSKRTVKKENRFGVVNGWGLGRLGGSRPPSSLSRAPKGYHKPGSWLHMQLVKQTNPSFSVY